MADAPHIETTVHAPTAERAAEQDASTLGQHNLSTEAPQASAGLPQFQFQHWPGQIAYLLILFAILYVLMSKVFAPRIRKIFDERQATIGGAISSAKLVQAEAASQAEAARKALAEARASAQKTAADAKAKADAEAKERQGVMETELAVKMSRAEARIGESRASAMTHVDAVAIEAAHAIVEKLTGVPASDEQVAAALVSLQG